MPLDRPSVAAPSVTPPIVTMQTAEACSDAAVNVNTSDVFEVGENAKLPGSMLELDAIAKGRMSGAKKAWG